MIYPTNRYLVVAPIEHEASAFCLVELVEPNAGSSLRKGMKLIAQSHLLERAEIAGNTYYLLLENHVVGFLGGHEKD